jgi:hypothetical protein
VRLNEALSQLVGAELIYRRGTPPDAEYTFKHALVQDAAYSTLLRGRRQQLHAHIAATLEDRFPEIIAAQPALLAHHCEEARLSEKAVDYRLAAGRQAWGRSMLAEAAALLRRGLALVPGLPDSDWRLQRELDLQIALGQALCNFQSWGALETGEAYARAQQLSVKLNRPRDVLLALDGQIYLLRSPGRSEPRAPDCPGGAGLGRDQRRRRHARDRLPSAWVHPYALRGISPGSGRPRAKPRSF